MRLYRLSFVAGFAAGFVAGTRAGREKYDQMVKFAKNTAENPTVQQAAGAIQAQATALASTAAQKVGGQFQDKVPHIAHNVGDRIPGLKHRNSAANGAAESGDKSVPASHNGHGKSTK